jgi:hypothetical protein
VKRVFIDSDIFVRDLRYPHDEQTKINQSFLKKIKENSIRGATSIFNVLEICGIMSFNLKPPQLVSLYEEFCQHYHVQVLFPADATGHLQYDVSLILEQIMDKHSLGDAQISYVITRFADSLTHLVSWNARHFKDSLPVPAMTPKDYLDK